MLIGVSMGFLALKLCRPTPDALSVDHVSSNIRRPTNWRLFLGTLSIGAALWYAGIAQILPTASFFEDPAGAEKYNL